jgi:hypothetical protein
MQTSFANPPYPTVSGRARLVRSLDSARPWIVAATILVAYLTILIPLVAADGADSFARVGRSFTGRSDRSARISNLRTQLNLGYDGQFAYFIALDPRNARYYMDSPSYRYGRVFYPAVARATALGQPGAIPYTLLGINLLAIVGTSWLLAVYLRRRRVSAWWAAVYGFFPGLMICLYSDLTEPLAYFLATAGVVLLLERKPASTWMAALLFALAVLTRETTLVFPLVCAAWLLVRPTDGARIRSGGSAAVLVGISVAPYLVYRLLVDRWLGTGFQKDDHVSRVPFRGFTSYPFDDVHRLILLTVIAPALVWLALSLRSAMTRGLDLGGTLLVANVLLFVVWLPSDTYADMRSAYRALIPVVLSALLLMPKLREQLRTDLVAAAVFTFTLVWTLLAASLALL